MQVFLLSLVTCSTLSALAAYKEYRQNQLLPLRSAQARQTGTEPASYQPYE